MPLKIQYASDLHLEFPANKEFLRRQPLQAVGEILVLAGDVVPLAVLEQHQDFFSFVADHFKTTYWLPGNHEYYQFDLADKSGVLHEAILSNVFLVNNVSVVHEQLKLIFSTLWSNISPGNLWQIERGLNDFRYIQYKGHRFSAEVFNELHHESLAFIRKETEAGQKVNTAVFTHYCPTFLNYPAQFKGDALNEAFAVELYELIASSEISAWVYGHHHTNTPAFSIGNTRLLTNQLGYVARNEHQTFERDKAFEFANPMS
ncbi:MAG: metallophosphoesterase [Sphingobacteriaceae bacterium]|nr:metallophosphoesterase [Sphingobacteriaceae bacterium]